MTESAGHKPQVALGYSNTGWMDGWMEGWTNASLGV